MNGTAPSSEDTTGLIASIAAKAALPLKSAETESAPEATAEADDTDAVEPLMLQDDDINTSETREETSVADRIAAMELGSIAEDETTSALDETADASDGADVDADVDAIAEELPEAEIAETDAEPVALMEGTLSDEDEADLMQELAEAEAEGDADDAGPTGRAILPENDDAALSRIMDQADAELSEPEGNRRRNAIAQLKAAVAATEAARQLGDNAGDKRTQENAFREDFKEVVRPRPVSALPRTEVRRERPRPAPLKLVASQRVDETSQDAADDAPIAPVSPRRVATTPAALTTDAGNFAEFAEEMGATELPDLLEAAAAYIAYVEGGEDFSRPQIIKKVQATTDQAFSREDGLRSFGTLLRQGRINKARNGRFQVSDQTRFKPAKQAG